MPTSRTRVILRTKHVLAFVIMIMIFSCAGLQPAHAWFKMIIIFITHIFDHHTALMWMYV